VVHAPEPSVEIFRQRSVEFAEKARRAQSPESQKAFEDLAEMYRQMAESIEHLDELWRSMREAKL
jgi:hypothetical protein